MTNRSLVSALLIAGGIRPASSGVQTWIAGYDSITSVNDHAAIDLDVRELEKWLDVGIFQQAQRIYMRGAHSKSIAQLKLVNAEPPLEPLPAGTLVFGTSTIGGGVQGRLTTETFWTANDDEVILMVEYDRDKSPDLKSYCQVGALAVTQSAWQEGCFMNSGEIHVLHYSRNTPAYVYKYVYDVDLDNVNGRTLAGFSTDAFQEMWNCTNCPYKTFNKFVEYYGAPDYGDKMIKAAFNAEQTEFRYGSLDFTNEPKTSRCEAVKIAAKFVNVWMYVIRMMEYALDRCEEPCKKPGNVLYDQRALCDDSPVRAWDQAVAFYAGSLEGDSGVGEGLLLFDLADRMCPRFLSCGDDADLRFGVSYVNNMVVNEFMNGQVHVLKRDCQAVRQSKNQIEKLMVVPLIQATLLNTYEQSYSQGRTPEEDSRMAVESATYAATVLPLVHDCSPKDADIIYQNFRFGGENNETVTPDYKSVKEAFERNYKCMGVACKAVGGIWNGREYFPYADPCQDDIETEDSERRLQIGLVTVSIGFALVLSALIYLIYHRFKDDNEAVSEINDREPSHIPPGNLQSSSRELD